jgi:hypothetical protein
VAHALLGQLLGEFYAAKLREQTLRQASYLQAVHETGAALTHDVKNLLQSLNVLCSVAAQDDSPQLQALIRRQLPAITQRLQATLDKLQRPGDEESLPCRWANGGTRWCGSTRGRTWTSSPTGSIPRRGAEAAVRQRDRQLPAERIAKRAAASDVRIRVSVQCNGGPELRVQDSGAAVPEDVAASLCARRCARAPAWA